MAQPEEEEEEREPGAMQWIGLAEMEGYGDLVTEKWEKCCIVLDNLISFDGSGIVDSLSLVNILKGLGVEENLDPIMQAVDERNETPEPLTKRILENNLFATVQEMPNFPLEQIFETAIKRTQGHQTFLIVGLLGRGKSALSQFLAEGEHDTEATDAERVTFKAGDMGIGGGGVTTDFWIGHYPFLGHDADKWITIIDTPGGNDEKLPNFENFKRMQVALKKIRFINTIVLVVSPHDIQRRTESLNTYLQEFALMIQQDRLCENACVVVTRGNLIPMFFQTEERFDQAFEEAIMKPLRESFSGEVPVFRMSISKKDYMVQPELENEAKEAAHDIYELYQHKEALDCQQMVSLETRIKRLIQKHVALQELQKKTQTLLDTEIEEHNECKQTLADTEKTLEDTQTDLERTTSLFEETKEDLERWREKHSQLFEMHKQEREEHAETRDKLEAERENLRQTQAKWDAEVKHHHETQLRLENEIRDHKKTKVDLEEEVEKSAEALEELAGKTKDLKNLQSTHEEHLNKLRSAESDVEKLADKVRKLEKGGNICVIQ